MKTTLPFIGFSLFMLMYVTSVMDIDPRISFDFGDRKSEVLVFDGYEGGYLFFTNSQHQPVVLEINSKKVLKNIDLIDGDYVGKQIKVEFEEADPNADSSSMGVIRNIDVIQ